MFKKIKYLIKNENGQSLIMVALCLTVLLGFVAIAVDYGYLAYQKRQLQNAADAAALAGAYELPNKTFVHSEAREFAKKNAKELSDENISIDDNELNNSRVKVEVEFTYDTFFARVIGINNQAVYATATAERTPWFEDLLPIASLNLYGDNTKDMDIDDFTEYITDEVIGTDIAKIDLWEKIQSNPSNHGFIYLDTTKKVNDTPQNVLLYGNIRDITDATIGIDPGTIAAVENADKYEDNGQTFLSDRLELQDHKGYILGIRPDRIRNEPKGNEKHYYKPEDYVILYLENFYINYDDNDKIVKNNRASGEIKGVYNLYDSKVPLGLRIRLIK